MILLQKIKLNNFLSHGDTEIDFKPEQNLLIDGKSGSGKSSIVEGLIWALYGKGRTDNKSLIKKGTKKATVVVIIEDDKEQKKYKIQRSITDSNKHSIEVMESPINADTYEPIKTTGVRGAQEYLETDILHSSYILFINSIAYPQDSVENFVKQTAAKRKDIILEIINNAGYDDYLKITKDKLTEYKTNSLVNSSRIEDRERIITDIVERQKQLDEHRNIVADCKLKISGLEGLLNIETTAKELLSKDVVVLNLKQKERVDAVLSRDDIAKKIKALEVEVSNIKLGPVFFDEKLLGEKKLELEKLNKQKDLAKEWLDKRYKLITETPHDPGYASRVELLNKQLIELINEGTTSCPKCGYTDTDLKARYDQKVQILEKDLKHATEQYRAIENALLEHSQRLVAIGEEPVYDQFGINAITNEIGALEKARFTNNEILELDGLLHNSETMLKSFNEAISNIDTQISGLSKVEEEYLANNRKIEALKLEIGNLNNQREESSLQVAMLEREIDNINKAKEELVKFRKEQDKLNKDISSLELLKDALGQNGIKAIVIDYVIPQLEDRINDILSKLSDFRIRLDTQKSGLTKGTTLEGLFISIINGFGGEFSYESFSGGEKVKISMAINESLAEFSSINFRILDEAVVSLDDESTLQFIEAMTMIQGKVSQIFCISHIDEIKLMFDNKINIVNISGDSMVSPHLP